MTWSADSTAITADGAPLTWTADGYLPVAMAVFIALVLPAVNPDLVISHSSQVTVSSVSELSLSHSCQLVLSYDAGFVLSHSIQIVILTISDVVQSLSHSSQIIMRSDIGTSLSHGVALLARDEQTLGIGAS